MDDCALCLDEVMQAIGVCRTAFEGYNIAHLAILAYGGDTTDTAACCRIGQGQGWWRMVYSERNGKADGGIVTIHQSGRKGQSAFWHCAGVVDKCIGIIRLSRQ